MESPLSLSLFLLLSPFEWARSVSDDSFIAFYAGRLSRPLCIDMPPYPSHSYDIFLHFQVFLSSVLACLHPFLKKAASCRESRHKLLTFPPPRNSRAILSLSERGRKEGRKRESIWRWVCFLWQPLSRWLMGNKGISRRERESKDYGTIYRRRRRRPDLENHIKPYIYDYLWTSLSQEGRKREAILLTEAKWLL